MKEIKLEKTSIFGNNYYTDIRSLHYDQKNKTVRISYMSDQCSDQEFLDFIYRYIPELENKELKKVYHDGVEWLCDWNIGNPKGGAFMISVFFFN